MLRTTTIRVAAYTLLGPFFVACGTDTSASGLPADAGLPDQGGGGDATGVDAGCGGKTLCSTGCVDTASDPANCGACGHACGSAFGCASGMCGNAVVSAGMGTDHACVALASGDVWCWGANQAGQLGVARTTTSSTVPVKVNIGKVTVVACGDNFTCVHESDDTVWCWGKNSDGRVGHTSGQGTPADEAPCGFEAACNAVPQQVASLGAVDQVLTEGGMGCGHTSVGAVKCWGDLACGTLGDPNAVESPNQPPTAVAGVSNVKLLQTPSGATFTQCVIENDATVVCWGTNGSGEAGHTPEDTPPACHFEGLAPPIAVAGLTNATSVSTGFGSTTCATAQGGQVYCWGDNSNGVVLPGTTDASAHPTPTLIAFSTSAKARKVVAGGRFACALFDDGTVQCWGPNDEGVMGNGTTSSALSTPAPVTGVTTAIDVAAGQESVAAILKDGTLLMWGFTGQQASQPVTTPSPVTGLP